MPGMPYKIKSIVTRKLEGVNHFHYYLCRQLKGGGMEIIMLRTRVKNFIEELEMPITIFCRKVKLSPASYYKWKDGYFEFSDETAEKVSDFIKKYGF